jgi:catechol 2,3-dioxygenase-like lactoylglutathione lyase family enzyme
MPPIAGQVVILTVSDADQSATWYRDLVGMDETSRYVQLATAQVLTTRSQPGQR